MLTFCVIKQLSCPPQTEYSAVRLIALKSSPSPTSSSTATKSPDPVSTLSASLSTTATPSQSASPPPFAMTISMASASTPSSSMVVSDALQSSALQLRLNRCPTESDAALLASSSVACASAGAPSVFVSVSSGDSSSAGAFAKSAACDPAGSNTTGTPLTATVRVGARFRSGAAAATLTCSIIEVGASSHRTLALAKLPLTVIPTLRPLWDDAIVVSAAGLMRSARLRTVVNASAALSDATDSVSESASSVIAAARALWGNVTLPNASASPEGATYPAPFTLTLVGASRVILRYAGGYASFATNLSTASLGGVPCRVSAVSEDGAWAVLDTPSSEQLCAGNAIDCGYATLVLSNSPSPAMLGATLACPPFCPGVVGGSTVPIAVSGGAFALGTYPMADGSLPSLLPAVPASSALGVYYAVDCAAAGLWTDPLTGACSNASDPRSFECAYSGRGGCVACPSGGLCPGGSRLWPRAGYWVASDTSSAALPCPPPNPGVRCGGWDITAGTVKCGSGFRPGSYLCASCDDGLYSLNDGSCSNCPAVSSPWDRYRGLLLLIVGTVAAACLVGLVLAALVSTVGGDDAGIHTSHA